MSDQTAIEQVVETAIYADDLIAMEKFYCDVLGLTFLARQSDRHVFLKAGKSVLLIFRPDESLIGDTLPAHGTTGPGHFALGIPTSSRSYWLERLNKHGVAIEQEVDWPLGGQSIYFRDPAGNAVELITRGVWGLPEGW